MLSKSGLFPRPLARMCSNYVYKRRKLQNSVALLSAQNRAKDTDDHGGCNSSSGSKTFSLMMQKDEPQRPRRHVVTSDDGITCSKNSSSDGDLSIVLALDAQIDKNKNLTSFWKSEAVNNLPVQKEKNSQKGYENGHIFTSDYNSSVNDSCSSSKSHLEQHSASAKSQTEDAGECSSSDIISAEPVAYHNSSRDVCIHFLKSNGLLGGSWTTHNFSSLDILGGEDAKFCLPCKTCGVMGNPWHMLICDLCGEAFHLHCCHEKGPFREDWYCRPCYSKKPKPLLDAATGKSSITISEEYKRRILQRELGPILFMLKDTKPYISRVRVGKDFQAEVPKWSGPVIDNQDYFGEPSKLDHVQYPPLDGCSSTKLYRHSSIGNWIQCREVIYDDMDKNGSGVVCGKWRRAPLFVTQTDDWDCSCSVVWDPFHADCAVPQELETEEVLKHLKYVELLRTRLDKKQACGQTKGDVRR